ncbi:MAG: AEC family transporter [Scytolyngbya sp. HA4215-MV1]|nr:AEC family transporter [Scytolyngbya sp. HA4215-MV1]
MVEVLFRAYSPLILWTGLGILLFRFLPQNFPRLLGRSLYWVGIPLEILALARQADFSGQVGLAPFVTVIALLLGLALSWLSWRGLHYLNQYWQPPPEMLSAIEQDLLVASTADATSVNPPFDLERHRKGSFFLAATLGNTGFVGLAIVPSLVSSDYLSWAVFYSVTHNLIGIYVVGVLVASYFGRTQQQNHWWIQARDMLTVPSLWTFAIGFSTRSVSLPIFLESGLNASIWLVIPSAFLLTGIRLSQLKGMQSLRMALIPVVLKTMVLPGLVGTGLTVVGITGDPRLVMVLMAGMPSAFAGLILAEEYDLDRDLVTSSIALTTVTLLMMIPVWLALFH